MEAVGKLKQIVAKAPSLLMAISPEEASRQTAVGKWSKKQELGHLVDSACNNHQRIVRAQVEEQPVLADYDGDQWVALHNYQAMDWNEMIECWRVMNQQLVRAASIISPRTSNRKLTVGGGNPVTLAFLVDDYVDHLLHHLRHIGVDFVLGDRPVGLKPVSPSARS
jgi:DinB superfamily